MADGLAARAGAVDIGGVVRVEDAQAGGGEALGGHVDVGVLVVDRGGGGEEEGLGEGLVREWMRRTAEGLRAGERQRVVHG